MDKCGVCGTEISFWRPHKEANCAKILANKAGPMTKTSRYGWSADVETDRQLREKYGSSPHERR